MRVFTGEWAHETNTFSIVPTTVENFQRAHYLITDEDMLSRRKGTKTTIGATYESAEKYNWTLDTSISADANPTGKITNDTFEHICNLLVSKLEKGKYDGILLHLHGAMVTESYEDAEGEILRRIREIVGNDIPIVVTLDLHGNITTTMAKHASSLIAVRTYPHIDFYEMALKGADLLQRAMKGEVKLHTVIARRPQLKGLDGGKTHIGSPMRDLIDRGEALEALGGEMLIVSVCSGFTAADIYDIGE
jgi:microcystin degradation protein MlrC